MRRFTILISFLYNFLSTLAILSLLVILACFDKKQWAEKNIYFKHSFSDQMETDTSSSSSDDDDDDDELLDAAEVICVAEAVLAWRSNRMTRSRLHWQHHIQMLLHENQFHIMYRITISSFNNHLELLSPNLQLNERFAQMCCGAPITCDIMLHCTIHF
jgi:hypothetical protein